MVLMVQNKKKHGPSLYHAREQARNARKQAGGSSGAAACKAHLEAHATPLGVAQVQCV